MIDSNKDLVTSLETKVDLLVKRYQGVSADNLKLQLENKQLNDKLNTLSEELTETQSKYEHLKLAKTFELSQGDGHDAKLKINQMVREIDKCIALLNRE